MRWLHTLGFARSDQSVYIIPTFTEGFMSESVALRQVFHHQPGQGSDYHLSLHETGMVNLSSGRTRTCLRASDPGPLPAVRHLATCQVNSIEHLPAADTDEVERGKRRYTYFPAFLGLPVAMAPFMLSIFVAKNDLGWEPPLLGDALGMHLVVQPQRDWDFHFLTWQQSNVPRGRAEIAIQFGTPGDGMVGHQP